MYTTKVLGRCCLRELQAKLQNIEAGCTGTHRRNDKKETSTISFYSVKNNCRPFNPR
jgi:hypothetical protein